MHHVLTATHYNPLQHTVQHTATRVRMARDSSNSDCNKLQHTATYCNTRQLTAPLCNTHCNILQHTCEWRESHSSRMYDMTRNMGQDSYMGTATHRNSHCNMLQHTCELRKSHSSRMYDMNRNMGQDSFSSRCNTLQHAATHCNTHCNTLHRT